MCGKMCVVRLGTDTIQKDNGRDFFSLRGAADDKQRLKRQELTYKCNDQEITWKNYGEDENSRYDLERLIVNYITDQQIMDAIVAPVEICLRLNCL